MQPPGEERDPSQVEAGSPGRRAAIGERRLGDRRDEAGADGIGTRWAGATWIWSEDDGQMVIPMICPVTAGLTTPCHGPPPGSF